MTGIFAAGISLVTAVAMLFAPAGEVKELHKEKTVKNIVIEMNGEKIESDMEITGGAKLSGDELAVSVHIDLNGEQLFPLEIKLMPDELKAKINGSEQVLSITEAALEENIGADEAQTAATMLESEAKIYTDYRDLISYCMDQENSKQLMEISVALLVKDATSVPETVTVDGREYEAQAYDITLTFSGMMEMLDGMMSCGIAPVENYSRDMLEMMKGSMNSEAESFAELVQVSEAEANMDIPMHFVFLMNDEILYETVAIDVVNDEMVMKMTASTVSDLSNTVTAKADMNVVTGGENVVMNLGYTLNTEDKKVIGGDMDLTMSVATAYDYSCDYETDEGATETKQLRTESTTVVGMTASGAKTDAGWNVEGAFTLDNSAKDTEIAEDGTETVAIESGHKASGELKVESEKETEDSCVKHVSFALNLDQPAVDIKASFDVSIADREIADAFTGTEEVIDVLSAGTDELMGAVGGLQADAMKLLQDPGIMKLMTILSANAAE